jgi:hypothetical protein
MKMVYGSLQIAYITCLINRSFKNFRKRLHTKPEVITITMEDHSDKQWSDSMLHNLYKCRKVIDRLLKKR